MSESLWKKLNYIAGLLTIGVLFSLLVFLANIEIKDLDLWLHIGMGRFIINNGFVPGYDILSSTIAGSPWINHEWLFQVIVFLLFDTWGPNGLVMMQVATVGLTLLVLLVLGYEKDNQLIVIFSLLLVLLVYELRFTFRPDLFSLLFFALYILILSMFIHRKSSVYSLFIVQVLWTNIHGFFFFGPLFVSIGLVTEWIKRHVKLPYEWNKVGRLTDDEFSRLKFIFVMVILACILNPMTFKGAWYPIKVFFEISGESKIFFEHIMELQKPIQLNDLFSLRMLPYFKLLILISFMSFVYNRRNIDVGVLLFWFLFLLFSLKAIRNIPFFACAAYLVIVTNALSLSLSDIIPFKFNQKKFQYLTEITLKVILIMWMLGYGTEVNLRGYFDFDKYERKSEREGISQRSYPNKAVDFLVENNIKGNIFNDFNSGAYLVGRCFPNIKVFMDGRTEVYGPKYFKTYQEIYDKGNFELFKELAEKYDITLALINTVLGPPKKILRKFYNDPDWKVVYFDYDAVIFFKDVPENKEMIKKYEIDLTKWKGKMMDIHKLGAKRVTPYRFITRAYTLDALKLYDGVRIEAENAIKINPANAEPYDLLGKIYGIQKNYQKAFEYFRIASVLDPGNRSIRYNLALSYYDLGQFNYAIHQYKKLIKHNPKKPKAYFLLSRAFYKEGEIDSAMEYLRKAHDLEPENINDLLAMSDMFLEDERYEQAKEIVEMAKETEKKKDEVYNKSGLIYKGLGDKEKAREAFQKALEFEPENEEAKKNLKKL